MAVDYSKVFQGLSSQAPVMDAQAAARLKAAQAAKAQQAVSSLTPQQAATQGLGQQIAAASVADAGQAAQQAMEQVQQTQGQLAQQAVQARAQQGEAALQQQGMAQAERQQGEQLGQGLTLQREELASKQTLSREDLAKQAFLNSMGISVDRSLTVLSTEQAKAVDALGRDVKAKLFDSRMSFEGNEAQRKFANERQLMDFAVASAKNEEDLKNKLQLMEQAGKKELIMMEAAYQKISAALERGFLDNERELDQATKVKLQEMKAAADRARKRKARNAANRRMIVGGVIMGAGVFAGPAAPAVVAAGAGYASGGRQ